MRVRHRGDMFTPSTQLTSSHRTRSLASDPPSTVSCRPAHLKVTPQLRSLDADWARARRRPSNLRRARAWPDLVPDGRAARALDDAVVSLSDLEQLVTATQQGRHTASIGSRPNPDEVLGALVTVAAVDDLAARVVLQRILPPVIAASRRFARTTFNDDRTDLAIGAAWMVVRSFNIGRRRRHVAAALVSDVMWSAFKGPARRKSQSEIPTPNDVFARTAADPIELDPIIALAGTVRAAAAAGIEDHDLEVIRELARAGSPGEMARRHNVTPRTIRNRRDKATHVIRTALGADWADWSEQLTAAA